MERLTHELVDALAAYENTELTPEQIIEMDKMYTELAKEVAQLRKRNAPRG